MDIRNMNRMQRRRTALSELLQRCRDGAEFPDAAYSVATKYRADQQTLEEDYMSACAERSSKARHAEHLQIEADYQQRLRAQ